MTREPTEDNEDQRLYVPQSEGCVARIKQTSEKEYCYFKLPGDEYYHLLGVGEIYLEHNGEKSCLNCALRHGLVSRNRMHWKRGN